MANTLQVHADASTFATGVSKSEAYEQVIDQMKGLLDGQRNWVCLTTMHERHLTNIIRSGTGATSY